MTRTFEHGFEQFVVYFRGRGTEQDQRHVMNAERRVEYLCDENARLRAAVRAADAMAGALLDKSIGAHECNGDPDRCWYCADNENDRAVVAAYDVARARCGDVTDAAAKEAGR